MRLVKNSWWEGRWFLVAIVLLSAVPLIFPETPPLVDVPGHIGRYRVELDLKSSPELQRYFEFHWALIGNLGVDLLLIPIAPLFGLELAVKLIVITIPVLTTAGIFWTAREVHGRVPPTTLFAIPFIYSFPFNFGFINFALSLALALLALPLWLYLGRRGKFLFRAMLFVPISSVIWLVHVFGWGALGLAIWSAELVRFHDTSKSWVWSALYATRSTMVLALPVPLMLVWRTGAVGGETGGFFDIFAKLFWLVAALRDRWLVWDTLGIAVALVLMGAAIGDRRLELSRKLAIPVIVLTIVFFILPWKIFGSAYADMRLVPLIFIISILAIRLRSSVDDGAALHRIACLGLLFVALRLGGNSLSFALAELDSQRRLQALNYIPRGAPVLSLIGDYCGKEWAMPRHSHLGSFVIVRKFGFSNDQWQLPGGQLLRVSYPDALAFQADPSEVIHSKECIKRRRPEPPKDAIRRRSAQQALDQFPRQAFDYVWVLRSPDLDYVVPRDLNLIWSKSDSTLYRVVRSPDRIGIIQDRRGQTAAAAPTSPPQPRAHSRR